MHQKLTCTVDIWSWVISHGELESGDYFDRGGRRAARFGFFSLPRRAAQRQRPTWFIAAAFSGCFQPPRAARRALKRAHATGAILGDPGRPQTQRVAQGSLWRCRAVPAFGRAVPGPFGGPQSQSQVASCQVTTIGVLVASKLPPAPRGPSQCPRVPSDPCVPSDPEGRGPLCGAAGGP